LATRDKSHLEWHGKQWRVTVLVPKAARAKLAKAHLKQSLGTHNLTTANLLKPPIVNRFKSQIEDVLREVTPAGGPLDEARAIRNARRQDPTKSRMVPVFENGRETDVEGEEDDAALIDDLAERLERTHGEDAALAFADVALGRATPIDEHLEAFKKDRGYQPKSALELDRSVRRFREWLAKAGRKQTLQAVNHEVGTAYVRDLIHGQGVSSHSVAKGMAFLRSYWGWLVDERHLPATTVPFTAKIPKAKSTGRHTELEPDEGKRPYTDDELKVLLQGPGGDLIPLIKIGALSGLRLEEMYRLRVRDVADGFFLVRTGKTASAKRRVPVHKDLETLVAALGKGKEPGTYLVDPSAPVTEKTGIRSGAVSKSFGRYRQGLGVDERPNGKVKSNVDFHSLRRWFIARARDGLLKGATGYNAWTIAEVAGHETGLTDTLKMTLGVYAGASGDEALKACVAAVRLPD
jgi:integrase